VVCKLSRCLDQAGGLDARTGADGAVEVVVGEPGVERGRRGRGGDEDDLLRDSPRRRGVRAEIPERPRCSTGGISERFSSFQPCRVGSRGGLVGGEPHSPVRRTDMRAD